MNNNLISCKCICKCLKRGMKARRDNWEEGTYIGLNTNNIIEFYIKHSMTSYLIKNNKEIT